MFGLPSQTRPFAEAPNGSSGIAALCKYKAREPKTHEYISGNAAPGVEASQHI